MTPGIPPKNPPRLAHELFARTRSLQECNRPAAGVALPKESPDEEELLEAMTDRVVRAHGLPLQVRVDRINEAGTHALVEPPPRVRGA